MKYNNNIRNKTFSNLILEIVCVYIYAQICISYTMNNMHSEIACKFHKQLQRNSIKHI